MEIVFATNNLHKLEEISKMLSGKYRILGLKELGISEEIPEDHDTLEENASQKAWYIYRKTGRSCFADDTGLEVDSLLVALRGSIPPGIPAWANYFSLN